MDREFSANAANLTRFIGYALDRGLIDAATGGGTVSSVGARYLTGTGLPDGFQHLNGIFCRVVTIAQRLVHCIPSHGQAGFLAAGSANE